MGDIPFPRPIPWTPAPKGPVGTFAAIFADEFKAPELDRSVWSENLWFNGVINAEKQAYRPEQITTGPDRLSIKVERKPTHLWWTEKEYNPYFKGDPVPADYASGLIHTFKKFHFTRGVAEIRAKVPKGRGLWSAFWLLSEAKPAAAEIDVFEILNNGVGLDERTKNSNYHCGGAHPRPYKSKVDLSGGMHSYTVEWAERSIVFYLDGVERGRIDGPTYDGPMHLIVNCAVAGSWCGPCDESTVFPQVMEVDHVRVWKRTA